MIAFATVDRQCGSAVARGGFGAEMRCKKPMRKI
jgi:hypothetical protein